MKASAVFHALRTEHSEDIKARHHAPIFMFQIVAVEHVPAPIALEYHDELNFLPCLDGNCVLPPCFMH